MIGVAVFCGGVAITAILAIVAVAVRIRQLPANDFGGYEKQSLAYTALLVMYVGLAAALVGGCIAIWAALGSLVP